LNPDVEYATLKSGIQASKQACVGFVEEDAIVKEAVQISHTIKYKYNI
jgi:hypothetical protein